MLDREREREGESKVPEKETTTHFILKTEKREKRNFRKKCCLFFLIRAFNLSFQEAELKTRIHMQAFY